MTKHKQGQTQKADGNRPGTRERSNIYPDIKPISEETKKKWFRTVDVDGHKVLMLKTELFSPENRT